MSNDKRDDSGRFAASVDDTDILEAIDQAPGPVATAAELADILPIGRRAIRERLLDLEERDKVARKTVGARSVVWWLIRNDATAMIRLISDPVLEHSLAVTLPNRSRR
ncbi:hypothetical protein [Halalkalicoccus salilacus]|uniref:hypothetical protein n=1 Tax=Halalkalicoccus TaxID=332246 RepID=UPI002F96D3C2